MALPHEMLGSCTSRLCQVSHSSSKSSRNIGRGLEVGGSHLTTMVQPLKGEASSLISFFFFPLKAMVRDFDLSWVCYSASPLPLSRPFQRGSAVLFFSNQKMSCDSVNVFLLLYFADYFFPCVLGA